MALKNCTITEASGFMPGSLHTMLGAMGVMPTQISPPAATPIVYSAQMTDEQINHFRLRGFSHKLEVEETPVVDPRDARIEELQLLLHVANSRIFELEAQIAKK